MASECTPSGQTTIDWASMTAEEVVEALRVRPTVLGPWSAGSFGGFFRHEKAWSRDPDRGDIRTVGVVAHTTGRWGVSGFGEYGTSVDVDSEQAGLVLADRMAQDRGWKLLGEVKT